MKSFESRPLRTAWLWLLGLPVAFVASFLGGGFLFSVVFRLEEGDLLPAPFLPGMIALLVALFGVPTLMTLVFGLRAKHSGAKGALVPASIALTVSVVFIAINLLSYYFA